MTGTREQVEELLHQIYEAGMREDADEAVELMAEVRRLLDGEPVDPSPESEGQDPRVGTPWEGLRQHDFGDGHRCIACGTTANDAPDQYCKPKWLPGYPKAAPQEVGDQPCPECGGAVNVEYYDEGWSVGCDDCEWIIDGGFFSEAEAIAALEKTVAKAEPQKVEGVENAAKEVYLWRYGNAWIPNTGRNLEMEQCRILVMSLLSTHQPSEGQERDHRAMERLRDTPGNATLARTRTGRWHWYPSGSTEEYDDPADAILGEEANDE